MVDELFRIENDWSLVVLGYLILNRWRPNAIGAGGKHARWYAKTFGADA